MVLFATPRSSHQSWKCERMMASAPSQLSALAHRGSCSATSINALPTASFAQPSHTTCRGSDTSISGLQPGIDRILSLNIQNPKPSTLSPWSTRPKKEQMFDVCSKQRKVRRNVVVQIGNHLFRHIPGLVQEVSPMHMGQVARTQASATKCRCNSIIGPQVSIVPGLDQPRTLVFPVTTPEYILQTNAMQVWHWLSASRQMLGKVSLKRRQRQVPSMFIEGKVDASNNLTIASTLY